MLAAPPSSAAAGAPSPFADRGAQSLQAGKFVDPERTREGAPRARVSLRALETLWVNTGTLCNLACRGCYIESSPRNDALAYFRHDDLRAYLDEADALAAPLSTVGFTGGEPFMNPEVGELLDEVLSRGLVALVLTNAMRPMRRHEGTLLALRGRFGDRLRLRVSLDHYSRPLHDLERGRGAWAAVLDGIGWLADAGIRLSVAGRRLPGESEAQAKRGYQGLFDDLGVDLDAWDPADLVLFPEMDATSDAPEISEACWGLLGKSPADLMCANSRMVVRRRGAERPAVVSCTLTPHDRQFEMGPRLADAFGEVRLNHPHCARFCVLGGSSCAGG